MYRAETKSKECVRNAKVLCDIVDGDSLLEVFPDEFQSVVDEMSSRGDRSRRVPFNDLVWFDVDCFSGIAGAQFCRSRKIISLTRFSAATMFLIL